MILQTDFMRETKNIERMFENCKNTSYIEVPYVYPEFTCANNSLIVMKYIEGRKMDEVPNEEKDAYSLLVAKFGMKCLLYNRFFHADLHPGNILFIKDADGQHKIGILDYGVMGEITREEQDCFYRFFTCLSSTTNYGSMVDIIIDELVSPLERLETLAVWERNTLHEEIGTVIRNVFDNRRSLSPQDIFDINSILRKYKLSLSRSFCKIELALAIADSVTQHLSYKTTYLDNIKNAVSNMFENNIYQY